MKRANRLKKNLRIALYLILVFFSTVSLANAAVPTLESYAAFDRTVETISDPQELVQYMHKNFTFVEDRVLFGMEDYWQTPRELWHRKTGDCEDYALFAQYVLTQKGTKSYTISIYGAEGFAHTVTVFEENGRYNVINEDRLYRYRAKTIEDALSRVYHAWRWGAIAKKQGSRGWMVERIDRPEQKFSPRFFPNLFAFFRSLVF